MSYLSFDEYKELSVDPVDEDEFNKLAKAAERIINITVRRFYEFNDFNRDAEWRQTAYKEAIAHQLDYFKEMGTTTFEGLNNLPQSVQLGRTMISQTSRFNAGGSNEKRSLLSVEAEMTLVGTGLLSRGVS